MRNTFLFSALAATLLFSPGQALAVDAPQPQVYVALGDSLAVGVGATEPERHGYVAGVFRLAHARKAGSVDRLVNLAVSGETSGSFISGGQLDRAITTIVDPTSDVRLVTIDIGGNDLLGFVSPGGACAVEPGDPACQVAVRAAISKFPSNYAAILTRLRQALATDPGEEELLVMTYYNPFSGTANVVLERLVDAALLGSDGRIDCAAVAAGDDRVGLNDLIACIGAQFGARTVDVQPLFVARGSLLTHIDSGDVHPNNAGYALITTTFGRAMRSGRRVTV